MKSLLASRISSLRFLSTSAPRTLKNKVPEYQKLFQEDNGLPVHLKGGTIDAMMYRGTMILSVFAKLREQIVSFFGLRMITVREIFRIFLRPFCPVPWWVWGPATYCPFLLDERSYRLTDKQRHWFG
ncbi:cytochrome c oxidase subunit 7A1, mitochondrial isoform X1 [Podarcis muralis]